MNDSKSSFEYDSVVSDDDGFTGVVDGISSTPGTDQRQRGAIDNGVNVLTPSTTHPDTPHSSGTGGYGYDDLEFSQIPSNAQSQIGLHSGMYNSSAAAAADFNERLKGNVEFSKKWSAIDNQQRDDEHVFEDESAYEIGSGHPSAPGMAPADDTFDFSSINQSSNSMMDSAMDRDSSAIPFPVREMEERKPTQKAAQTARGRNNLHVDLGNPQASQPAIRGSRTAVPGRPDYSSDSAAPGSAKHSVPFAPSRSSAAHTDNEETDESIMFREQDSQIDQTRPPWESSSRSQSRGGDDTAELSASNNRQRNISSMVHLPLSPAKLNMDSTSGVGIPGAIFRRFTGWAQNQLQLSPNTAAAPLKPASDEHDKDLDVSDDSDGSDNIEQRTPAVSANNRNRPKSNPNATLSSNASSALTTSSASPMGTEPMRSNVLSNFTNTPTSARTSSARQTPLHVYTPRRTPHTSRRLSFTPSRSVNPLARHIAMKVIQSTSSSQVNQNEAMPGSMGSTPTNRGTNGSTRMLYSSPGDASISENTSMASMLTMNVESVLREIDKFVQIAKTSESDMHDDIRQSQEAWIKMQQDLESLQQQLFETENERNHLYELAKRADLERAEWESERQNLIDDKADLMSNIDEWRRRIGDVESDRQGAWREGAQSREELLVALTQLDEQLHESRREARAAKRSLVTARAENKHYIDSLNAMDKDMASLTAENERLHMQCSSFAEENRILQADLYEAKVSKKEIREHAQKLTDDLQHAKKENERMDSELIEQKQQIKMAQIREAELVAETLRIRESNALLQRQIGDQNGQVNTGISHEAELMQEIEQLRESNQLLKESLEDLTEQNRELKAAVNSERPSAVVADTTSNDQLPTREQKAGLLDSAAIDTAISDSRAEAKAEALQEIEQLRSKFESDLARVTGDRELLLEQINDLIEEKSEFKDQIARLTKETEDLLVRKEDYKKENREYASLTEIARARVVALETQFADLQTRYDELQNQRDASNSSSKDMETDDIEQLRESEDQLRRELDSAERDREGLTERVRSLEDRNKQLSSRNDDLSQRTASLEAEISELQQIQNKAWENTVADSELASVEQIDPDLVHELHREITQLQTDLADLKLDLARRDESIDQLRQQVSYRDTLVDDLQERLSGIKGELELEKNALKSAQDALAESRLSSTPTANTSAATSPKLGLPTNLVVNGADLAQTLDQTIADVSDLKKNIDLMVERRSKLDKEQRYLADLLRDTLINNATLRSELAELVLRSDGKMKEVRERRIQLGNQYNDTSVLSDDGNASTMSGLINLVPSASQLIDSSGSKYLKSLDKHLDAMENIIDSEENESNDISSDQRLKQLMSSPLKRSRSLQAAVGTSSRMQRKILTPIKEEFTSHSLMVLKEASVECNIVDENLLKTVQNLEREVEQAHDQEFHMKGELETLRQTVSNIRHERDQFITSYEKAEERASQLSAQVEDLTADHERMKAINITAARVSIRVNRQIAVLKGALTRLAMRDSAQTNGSGSASVGGQLSSDSTPLSPLEADENQIALEEDDAFRQAAIDHPLDSDSNGNSELDLKSGEVLEQVGAGIYDAYEHIKRLRADIQRSKRERAHLMKRLGQFEHAKLPSYQLSSEWSRSMRHRSYTESLVRGQGDSNLTQLLTAAVEMAAADSWKTGDDDASSAGDSSSDRLIMDMEPPASLFLTDELEVAAGVATLDRKTKDKSKASKEQPGTILLPDGTKINKAVLSNRVAALAEIVHLQARLKRKSSRLLKIEQECAKLESINNDGIEKYDRLYGEYVELKHQVSSMKISADARSVRLTMTPVTGTNWDDIVSIEREMERCKAQSVAYMSDVEKLCQVLNQHTIDQALASDSTGVDPVGIEESALQTASKGRNVRDQPAKTVNVYRTLLIDMADVLDARGDLDDGMSIRENFGNMANAIRQRLDDKDKCIDDLRADLEDARKAKVSAARSSNEQQLRTATTRIADLEKQLSKAQEELQHAEDMLDSTDGELQKSRAAFARKSSEHIRLQNVLQTEAARADREARNSRNLETVLRNSDSQLEIHNWAREIWGDMVRTFVKDTMQLVRATPGGSSDEIRSLVTKLNQDTDKLDYKIENALEQADMARNESRVDSDDSFEVSPAQTSVSQRLDGIIRDLKSTSTTRLCESISSGITRFFSVLLTPRSGDYQYGLDSANSAGLLKLLDGGHELDSTQQAPFRQVPSKDIQELERRVGDYKHRLTVSKLRSDALDYENRYRRARLTIEYNRTRALSCQVGTLINLVGGYEELTKLIDYRVEQKRLSIEYQSLEDEDSRPRKLWRRARWVIRMIRNLRSLAEQREEAVALKVKGVQLTQELKKLQLKGRPNDQYQQQQQQQPQQRQPQYQPVPYYNGVKTAPITPSRLRNCTSDMVSSNGSSPEF